MRTGVWFPEPIWQLTNSVTPVLGDPLASPGLLKQLHSHRPTQTHTQGQTHIEEGTNINLKTKQDKPEEWHRWRGRPIPLRSSTTSIHNQLITVCREKCHRALPFRKICCYPWLADKLLSQGPNLSTALYSLPWGSYLSLHVDQFYEAMEDPKLLYAVYTMSHLSLPTLW